jgi:hypothetical protein
MATSLGLAACLIASVPLLKTGPYVAAEGVYVNGEGPLRFLIDTGAQSSAISDELAARLRLRPRERVEQVTAAGSRMVPLSCALVSLQGRSKTIEVVLGGIDRVKDVNKTIDGVLGNNFFAGLRFALDYRRGRLLLNAPVPAGPRVPFEAADGRIVVTTSIDGLPRRLVLDSGAPVPVLFEPRTTVPAVAMLRTHAGAVAGGGAKVVASIGTRTKRLQAVIVPRKQSVDGLLPASAFRSVFVDTADGFVIFEPKEFEVR